MSKNYTMYMLMLLVHGGVWVCVITSATSKGIMERAATGELSDLTPLLYLTLGFSLGFMMMLPAGNLLAKKAVEAIRRRRARDG